MIVNVGGKDYEISGIIYGTRPAWELIKHNGKQMTGQEFNILSDADKQALSTHVQEHLKQMRGN